MKGTCSEEHARQSYSYAGQIVQWRDDETREIATYGSVTNPGDLIQRDKEVVNDIVRLEERETALSRIRYYYFYPEDVVEVCEQLGLPVAINDYRFPVD